MGCCVVKDQGSDGVSTPRLSPQVVYPDGATYTGDTRHSDGLRHGEGICIWPDGALYEGQWTAGEAHGFGYFEHADGSAYEGQWRRGKAHGRGVFFRADESRYESTWRANAPVCAIPLPHGRGHIRWSDDSEHQAEYVFLDEAGQAGPSGLFPQACTARAAAFPAVPSECSGNRRGPWRGELAPDSSVMPPPAWAVGEWVPFRFSVASPDAASLEEPAQQALNLPSALGRISSTNSKSCPASMSSRATMPARPQGHALIVPKLPEKTLEAMDSDKSSEEDSEEHWEGGQASDASDMVERLKSMPRRRASSLDAERFGRGAFIPDPTPMNRTKTLRRRWTVPAEGSTRDGFFYGP